MHGSSLETREGTDYSGAIVGDEIEVPLIEREHVAGSPYGRLLPGESFCCSELSRPRTPEGFSIFRRKAARPSRVRQPINLVIRARRVAFEYPLTETLSIKARKSLQSPAARRLRAELSSDECRPRTHTCRVSRT